MTKVSTADLRVDLRHKTAIVTGAASGIGKAIVQRFGASGANVTIDHLPGQRDAAEAICAEVRAAGGDAEPVEADVSDEGEVAALVRRTVERFGGLDVLVNNAGIEKAQPFVETPAADWDRILRVNLRGPFLCAQAAARTMIARGRGGRIINISSVHEDLAMPNNAPYAASKGGLRMLMRTIALELAPHGITVNDIAPGAIATPINREVRTTPAQRDALLDEIPLHRIGQPEEVAALCAFLASQAAGYVTGATYVLDGGLMRYTKGL